MKRILPIASAILLVALVAMGTVPAGKLGAPQTGEAAVRHFLDQVKNHNWSGAYALVSTSSNIELRELVRELQGRDGSLRTLSSLEEFDTNTLRDTGSEATVRANLTWQTAVGALRETRDLRAVKQSAGWRVDWPAEKQPNLPAQVIPVNYLRWDIIQRNSEDEWGAQNVEAPHMRIVSMNAVERDGNTIILGEVVNQDTVPGFVSVDATLMGKDGSVLGQESSFDKISHTLLPKEVSPFRIDFPGIRLERVKNVRIQPNSLLVPAAADPVIGVLHQRLEKDSSGRSVLTGELVNQSGQIVNIPHVLATYYDNAGKVIWVADGYVDHALLPQTPVPFAVDLRNDLAANVHSYRVTVNEYSLDR